MFETSSGFAVITKSNTAPVPVSRFRRSNLRLLAGTRKSESFTRNELTLATPAMSTMYVLTYRLETV